MGEIAEMMLDGILDANGEYTGINPGYPIYPKGWFGENNNVNYGNKVSCFLKARGIRGFNDKYDIVIEYGLKTACKSNKFGKICRDICKDDRSWKAFKKFIDFRTGYVKPSKQAK